MKELERIAVALEARLDYQRHTCGPCDGVGTVIASFDRKDAMGMERDFSDCTIVPHPVPFELDFVNLRITCTTCDGTGRIVPKEQPALEGWLP